jgi:CBS domain-containing protein
LRRTVADVMTPPVAVAQDLLLVSAARMMRDHRVSALPVVESGRLVGVLTDRDIVVRAVAEDVDPHVARVGEVASYDPIRLRGEDPLEHALHVMATHQIRHLAVVDEEERVVGSVTQAGIARSAGPRPHRGLKRDPVLPIS